MVESVWLNRVLFAVNDSRSIVLQPQHDDGAYEMAGKPAEACYTQLHDDATYVRLEELHCIDTPSITGS